MHGNTLGDRAGGVLKPPRYWGQTCIRCVMDTTDQDILFDDAGICSHCYFHADRVSSDIPANPEVHIQALVAEIKEAGRSHDYDCVIGVSGGVDSSYVAWLCKKVFKLRPLAIHFDNGWNSELAVRNIEVLLKELDIDLRTHVVDWQEFRDLQMAFLKSSISNWELPTDHGIQASLYREARRIGVQHIVTGSNLATEALMPDSWVASATDLRLLKAIHRRFATRALKTFPTQSLRRLAWNTFIQRIRLIPLLNYVNYNKDEAASLLQRELGWSPYGFKHGESLFTKFYQRYYLPTKFGYDKRRPHLSSLVLAGQMTRQQALEELAKPLYEPNELRRDIAYVAKKLELAPEQLLEHATSAPKSDDAYPNSLWMRRRLPKLVAFARRAATGRRADWRRKVGGTNLHLYPSPLTVESRMLRITKAIGRWSSFERIVLAGMGNGDLPAQQSIDDRREIMRLTPPIANTSGLVRRSLRFITWYAQVIAKFRKEPLACINAHSLSTLPVAVALKLMTGAKLVYDTHELETETIGAAGLRKLLGKITEAAFIRFANATVVVGFNIADWYRDRYRGLAPIVIRNLPEEEEPGNVPERQDLFRQALNIPQSDMIFFYQGVLDRGRGVELTLEAFTRVPPDKHLVFLGYGRLQGLIEQYAARYPNIHFHPAVPPTELRKYTRSGDVGLCIVDPLCLSYRFGSPNKLFEYLACGVPVIATDLPEVGVILRSAKAGWPIDEKLETLVDTIRKVGREEAPRVGSGGIAWTRENSWAQEAEKLRAMYKGLGFIGPDLLAG